MAIKRILTIIIFLFSVVYQSNAQVQWETLLDQSEGPFISKLYVSENGALFLNSTGRMCRYEGADLSLPCRPTHAIGNAFRGRLYAPTFYGLYISDDDGITWKQTSLKAQAFSVWAVGDTIAVGGDGGAVYVSLDNGVSWFTGNEPIMPYGVEQRIMSVYLKNKTLELTELDYGQYLANAYSTFKGRLGSSEWAQISSGFTRYLRTDTHEELAFNRKKVFRIGEFANREFLMNTPVEVFEADVHEESWAIADVTDVYLSTNNGSTWIKATPGPISDLTEDINGVSFAPDGRLYIATTRALYRTLQPVQ